MLPRLEALLQASGTAQRLALLEQGYSTQVHDTNIVATMQAVGVGRIAVLKARMNADLYMAGNLKNTKSVHMTLAPRGSCVIPRTWPPTQGARSPR